MATEEMSFGATTLTSREWEDYYVSSAVSGAQQHRHPPVLVRQIGRITTDETRCPRKYFFSTRERALGTQPLSPSFHSDEFHVGAVGAAVASMAEWPSLWKHPERARTLDAIARLATCVDEIERDEWSAVLEAIEMALHLHGPANAKFERLASAWREETAFASDPQEMFLHPAYQQIIGMGTLALPFIFAALEKELDHWFWALNAITGEDPVAEVHRGNLDLMAQDWLGWAGARRRQLTLGWLHAFAAREVIDE